MSKKPKHKPLCRGCAVFSVCLGHPQSAVGNILGKAGSGKVFHCQGCKTVVIGTTKYDLLTVCAGFYDALQDTLAYALCNDCQEAKELMPPMPAMPGFPNKNGDVFPAPHPAVDSVGPDKDGYYRLPDGTKYKLTTQPHTHTEIHVDPYDNSSSGAIYIPTVYTDGGTSDPEDT